MKSLDNKLIVYDSNCKVCSSLRDVVLRVTPIPEAKVKAFKDLRPEWSRHVDPDKFRNVMALIDTKGGDTLYGAEGIAYIFSSQYRIVNFLLSFRMVFMLFNFLYKTQAYNRYIIATPKSNFKCDCFPDRVVRYRISYIVITSFIAVLLTTLFGVTLKDLFQISASKAATCIVLMAAMSWVIQVLIATVLLKEKALDYAGHLGSVLVASLLILVPWMVFHAFSGITNVYLPAVSVLLSGTCMLYLHSWRVRYLELSQAWTAGWLILLFLALTGTYYLYL